MMIGAELLGVMLALFLAALAVLAGAAHCSYCGRLVTWPRMVSTTAGWTRTICGRCAATLVAAGKLARRG